jgi:hypothetical protein
MRARIIPWYAPLVFVALVAVMYTARAQDTKITDGGKAEKFKSKTFDLKAEGKTAFTLAFPAGKEATVTVRSEKKTDIHLFVYDAGKKVVAKDDSPGPSCDVTLTPKEAATYTLEIINRGPGDNRCTLKVEFGKKAKSE